MFNRRFSTAQTSGQRWSPKLKLMARVGFPLLILIPYIAYVFQDRFAFHEERKAEIKKLNDETKARKASGKVLE